MSKPLTNSSNETQIRTLVENWARAVREGDMEGILAHHTDDIVPARRSASFAYSAEVAFGYVGWTAHRRDV